MERVAIIKTKSEYINLVKSYLFNSEYFCSGFNSNHFNEFSSQDELLESECKHFDICYRKLCIENYTDFKSFSLSEKDFKSIKNDLISFFHIASLINI